MTKTGVFIPFNLLGDTTDKQLKSLKRLESRFSIFVPMMIGPSKTYKCYASDRKKMRIIIPRFGAFEVLNATYNLAEYKITQQFSDGDKVKFEWKGALKPNQKIISDELMKNIYSDARIASGSAGCIVKLSAGQGKSYIAAYLMSKFNRKVAVILHTKALLNQWKDVIKTCYPNIDIGEYHSDAKKEGQIMFIIINSALSNEFTFVTKGIKNAKDTDVTKGIKNAKKPKEKSEPITKVYSAIDFYNQFGFIIYDECHAYNNAFHSKAFSIAQAKCVMGLSATPDECEPKIISNFSKWGLGPIVETATMLGYEEEKGEFKADVHQVKYYGPVEFTKLLINKFTETVSVASTINMLTVDVYRNALIIECVKKCLDLGLNVFVFADRRDYLEHLRLILEEIKISAAVLATDSDQQDEAKDSDDVELPNSDDYTRLVGGSKEEMLKMAAEKSKVILSTYQFMSTGVSIVKMTGLVLATPRKSKAEQFIKRIFRLGSDMTIRRHIYDIVDQKLTVKNQFSKRKKLYAENKFDIIMEEHTYQDVEKRLGDIIDISKKIKQRK